jgi:CelD/BcsL family acetyltransferase involved in cellulose biosynthesis
VKTIDPLVDSRWDRLLEEHPRSSIFHDREWLNALKSTYGFEPFVITSTSAGELRNGAVFCRISSWLSGGRAVSLPFSDHCEPLLNSDDDFAAFAEWLRDEQARRRYKYIEIRPFASSIGPLQASDSYYLHYLDIMPESQQIFRGLHKDSVQRRIRRAEGERLSYEVGRSEQMLDAFFRLFVLTRKRHGLPPPPRAWFSNLIHFMRTKIEIRLLRKNDVPIAGMISLRHKSTVVYKYGCSDHRFHHLGAVPLLFWRLIEESKSLGAHTIDFGRSHLHDKGLIAFKDKFGTRKQLLRYYRIPGEHNGHKAISTIARYCFPFVPTVFSPAVGKVLYKHIA